MVGVCIQITQKVGIAFALVGKQFSDELAFRIVLRIPLSRRHFVLNPPRGIHRSPGKAEL